MGSGASALDSNWGPAIYKIAALTWLSYAGMHPARQLGGRVKAFDGFVCKPWWASYPHGTGPVKDGPMEQFRGWIV